MKQADTLYKKLLNYDDPSGEAASINEKIRAKLLKVILDDLKKLRKKQQKNDYISEKYGELDHKIRLLLLKEIQVILDEHVLAKEKGTLKKWKTMYGEIEHYKRSFFYYRMDGKYEEKKKILKDYKFLDEELQSK
jgi:hypothetical protein